METEKHQFFYLYKNICHGVVFFRSERTDLRIYSHSCLGLHQLSVLDPEEHERNELPSL